MQLKLAVVVVECRVELVCPMDTAAIDDHHDLFPGFAEDRHHLMDILASLLGINVGHDCIEDFGRAILDGANDAEPHAAGDTAPRAIAYPRLAFERLFMADLTLAQWTRGEAIPPGAAPPAQPGQGKAPEDGFIFVEQNDLAPASPILQGSEFERGISEVGGVGIEPPRGTTVA
jgi:hypothetical protein